MWKSILKTNKTNKKHPKQTKTPKHPPPHPADAASKVKYNSNPILFRLSAWLPFIFSPYVILLLFYITKDIWVWNQDVCHHRVCLIRPASPLHTNNFFQASLTGLETITASWSKNYGQSSGKEQDQKLLTAGFLQMQISSKRKRKKKKNADVYLPRVLYSSFYTTAWSLLLCLYPNWEKCVLRPIHSQLWSSHWLAEEVLSSLFK